MPYVKSVTWFRLVLISKNYYDTYLYYTTKLEEFCWYVLENDNIGGIYEYGASFLENSGGPITNRRPLCSWSSHRSPSSRESIKLAKGRLCHTLKL